MAKARQEIVDLQVRADDKGVKALAATVQQALSGLESLLKPLSKVASSLGASFDTSALKAFSETLKMLKKDVASLGGTGGIQNSAIAKATASAKAALGGGTPAAASTAASAATNAAAATKKSGEAAKAAEEQFAALKRSVNAQADALRDAIRLNNQGAITTQQVAGVSALLTKAYSEQAAALNKLRVSEAERLETQAKLRPQILETTNTTDNKELVRNAGKVEEIDRRRAQATKLIDQTIGDVLLKTDQLGDKSLNLVGIYNRIIDRAVRLGMDSRYVREQLEAAAAAFQKTRGLTTEAAQQQNFAASERAANAQFAAQRFALDQNLSLKEEAAVRNLIVREYERQAAIQGVLKLSAAEEQKIGVAALGIADARLRTQENYNIRQAEAAAKERESTQAQRDSYSIEARRFALAKANAALASGSFGAPNSPEAARKSLEYYRLISAEIQKQSQIRGRAGTLEENEAVSNRILRTLQEEASIKATIEQREAGILDLEKQRTAQARLRATIEDQFRQSVSSGQAVNATAQASGLSPERRIQFQKELTSLIQDQAKKSGQVVLAQTEVDRLALSVLTKYQGIDRALSQQAALERDAATESAKRATAITQSLANNRTLLNTLAKYGIDATSVTSELAKIVGNQAVSAKELNSILDTIVDKRKAELAIAEDTARRDERRAQKQLLFARNYLTTFAGTAQADPEAALEAERRLGKVLEANRQRIASSADPLAVIKELTGDTYQNVRKELAVRDRMATTVLPGQLANEQKKLNAQNAVAGALVREVQLKGLINRTDLNIKGLVEQIAKKYGAMNLSLQEAVKFAQQELDILIKRKELTAALNRGESDRGPSDLGQAFLLGGASTAIFGTFRSLAERFREFESNLTQVRKTAGTTLAETERLGLGIIRLGQQVPVSVGSLTSLAGILGQVGAISREAGEDLEVTALRAVELVSQVALTSDLNAEQAAETFGQLRTIFSSDIRRIGEELSLFQGRTATSTDALRAMFGALNEISNQTVATVGNIREFIQNFGGVAEAAGVSFEAVTALGGAIRDLGISPQVAGTALSRLFQEASSKADTFAKVIGVTTEQFRSLFAADAQQAILRFIEALGQGGEAAGKTAEEVRLYQREILSGITLEQRATNTLLKLAQGYATVEANLDKTASTLTNYASVQEEAGKFSETYEAALNRLQNAFTSISVALEPLFRVFAAFANQLASLISYITDGENLFGLFVIRVVAAAAAVGGAIVAFRGAALTITLLGKSLGAVGALSTRLVASMTATASATRGAAAASSSAATANNTLAVSSKGVAVGMAGAAAATTSFKLALKGLLATTVIGGVLFAIGVGIERLISLFDEVEDKEREAAESSKLNQKIIRDENAATASAFRSSALAQRELFGSAEDAQRNIDAVSTALAQGAIDGAEALKALGDAALGNNAQLLTLIESSVRFTNALRSFNDQLDRRKNLTDEERDQIRSTINSYGALQDAAIRLNIDLNRPVRTTETYSDAATASARFQDAINALGREADEARARASSLATSYDALANAAKAAIREIPSLGDALKVDPESLRSVREATRALNDLQAARQREIETRLAQAERAEQDATAAEVDAERLRRQANRTNTNNPEGRQNRTRLFAEAEAAANAARELRREAEAARTSAANLGSLEDITAREEEISRIVISKTEVRLAEARKLQQRYFREVRKIEIDELQLVARLRRENAEAALSFQVGLQNRIDATLLALRERANEDLLQLEEKTFLNASQAAAAYEETRRAIAIRGLEAVTKIIEDELAARRKVVDRQIAEQERLARAQVGISRRLQLLDARSRAQTIGSVETFRIALDRLATSKAPVYLKTLEEAIRSVSAEFAQTKVAIESFSTELSQRTGIDRLALSMRNVVVQTQKVADAFRDVGEQIGVLVRDQAALEDKLTKAPQGAQRAFNKYAETLDRVQRLEEEGRITAVEAGRRRVEAGTRFTREAERFGGDFSLEDADALIQGREAVADVERVQAQAIQEELAARERNLAIAAQELIKAQQLVAIEERRKQLEIQRSQDPSGSDYLSEAEYSERLLELDSERQRILESAATSTSVSNPYELAVTASERLLDLTRQIREAESTGKDSRALRQQAEDLQAVVDESRNLSSLRLRQEEQGRFDITKVSPAERDRIIGEARRVRGQIQDVEGRNTPQALNRQARSQLDREGKPLTGENIRDVVAELRAGNVAEITRLEARLGEIFGQASTSGADPRVAATLRDAAQQGAAEGEIAGIEDVSKRLESTALAAAERLRIGFQALSDSIAQPLAAAEAAVSDANLQSIEGVFGVAKDLIAAVRDVGLAVGEVDIDAAQAVVGALGGSNADISRFGRATSDYGDSTAAASAAESAAAAVAAGASDFAREAVARGQELLGEKFGAEIAKSAEEINSIMADIGEGLTGTVDYLATIREQLKTTQTQLAGLKKLVGVAATSEE